MKILGQSNSVPFLKVLFEAGISYRACGELGYVKSRMVADVIEQEGADVIKTSVYDF